MGSGNVQKSSEKSEVLDSRFYGNDGISDGGGFAFEVQLSLTEKGQYAVAYGLSCKKDCHE
ncbi:TPA: hypothetical protein ACFORP_001676, partial [Neisseria meningitidis]